MGGSGAIGKGLPEPLCWAARALARVALRIFAHVDLSVGNGPLSSNLYSEAKISSHATELSGRDTQERERPSFLSGDEVNSTSWRLQCQIIEMKLVVQHSFSLSAAPHKRLQHSPAAP